MSARAAGLLLFAVAFVALPVPMLGLDGSFVPPARFVQLAAVMCGLVLNEGAGGMVGTLVALFVAHALVYTGLLALLCFGVTRLLLGRLAAARRRALVTAFCIALLVAGSFGRLYDTQFHHARAHATLLELYR